MSNLNENQFSDHLAAHGLSTVSQKAMAMRAAAVPASDFEGEYAGYDTSKFGNAFLKLAGEERVRELKVKKAYGK